MTDTGSPTNSSTAEIRSMQWADIIVLCALPIELDALRSELTDDRTFTHDAKLKLDHFIVAGDDYRIVIARLPPPGGGNVISGVVTSKLITTYGPWLIVSFGIAGTLKDDTIKLEDVVYAYEVDYGDLRKDLGEKGSVWKNLPKVVANSVLMSILRELRDGFVSQAEFKFKVHEVLLLSSEAVIRSVNAKVRKLASFALADAHVVEMEAFGVCLSCDWALYHREEGPLSIAIKGISDLADATKNDRSHRPAALNAAKVLRNLIEHQNLAKLAQERRFRSLPNVERRHQRNYGTAKEDTKQFLDIIQPLMALEDKDEINSLLVQLAAAHMAAERPPVFYHWRLTGQGIHWVDFYFLRVFRDLARRGYPISCLVTDEITTMPHNQLRTPRELQNARTRVGEMVRSVLGDHSRGNFLVWLSDLTAPEVESGLKSFVGNSGYDFAASRDILVQPSFAGPKEEINYQFDLWFKWIAWSCRHDGVGIVFTRRETRTYEFLRLFGTFQPFFVPTREFLLAAESGKKDRRWLYLDPPNHPQICAWLDKEVNPATLLEFLTHLRASTSCNKTLADESSDCDQLRSKILDELMLINREWFGILG